MSRDPPVFTAIAFPRSPVVANDVDDDTVSMITQPLLMMDYQHHDDGVVDDDEYEQDDEDDDVVTLTIGRSSTKRSHQSSEMGQRRHDYYYSRFVVLGSVTGFLIQVISLGAYALMLVQYQSMNDVGSPDVTSPTLSSSSSSSVSFLPATFSFLSGNGGAVEGAAEVASVDAPSLMWSMDWFVYGVLSILTQIDLIIYVLIWIAFTCTMTKNGMQFLRFQFASAAAAGCSSGRSITSKTMDLDVASGGTTTTTTTTTTLSIIKRRFVFVLGVYFLVGIVLGAFAAWSMIDVYLGFPIPFMPIVATVGIDLVLCYLMVWCYDLGRNSRRTCNSNGSISHNGSTATLMIVDDDDDEDYDEDCACC